MLQQNVRPSSGPSRFLYVLGALVILGGFVGGGWTCAKTVTGVGSWLTRVVVPGESELTLAEAGKYTVYYEHRSVMDGKPYSSAEANPTRLQYVLTNKETGADVALTTPSSNETYDFGPRSGAALMVFTISEPGQYELSGRYPEGQEGPRLVLAVGRGVVKRLATAIMTVVAAVIGSILVGVGVIVVTAVMRAKAARRSQAAAYPQHGAYPGTGGQPPGPLQQV
jgi:hypothetical protein